ncbi:MAG TPA: ParA family protein [Ignavibacteriaceae bacterium]|jgi:chromosome partitioning protein
MGKIIAIAIPKGGVGKTTTAINLSIAFALSEKKTLLIDLDPSGSCASGLGFNSNGIKEDIFNVLQFSASLQQVIQKTEVPFLDFIPIKQLAFNDEVRLGKISSNEQLLSNILRPEAFAYDHIVIDCPPYLIGTTNAALIAADSVIVPIAPGQFSLNAVKKIIEHLKTIKRIYNPQLKVEGILLTMYEFSTKVSFSTKKELFRKYPNLIFNTAIPKNVTVGEATLNNKPVIIYDRNARASQAYIKLAEEIMRNREVFYLRPAFDE